MEIVLDQEIYYSNREHLPLGDIATALLAIEKSVCAAPDLIGILYEGVIVHDIRVFVEELKSGSLTEKLKYFFRVAAQKHLEDASGVELGSLDEIPEDKRNHFLAWAGIAILAFAAKIASEQYFGGEAKENISQQVNIVIQQGHEITGKDHDELRQALAESIRRNPDAVKAAVDFIKPAKKDGEASISIDGHQYFTKEAISEIPSTLREPEEKQKSVELARTEVQIRATDKDSGKRGWGATIAEFSDRRMRLSISPSIDLNFVAHHDVVVGYVSIFYSVDSKGNVSKPHGHLLSIDEEATKSLSIAP